MFQVCVYKYKRSFCVESYQVILETKIFWSLQDNQATLMITKRRLKKGEKIMEQEQRGYNSDSQIVNGH